MPPSQFSEFREWSIAAVRLLQGVVYVDEGTTWTSLLGSQTQLEGYFARLGLMLVVDESEGLAYLRQTLDDELPEGYERLPKLFRRTRLGYWVTLLCVILREELRRFEEEDVNNARCVVGTASLQDEWRAFFPASYDDVRQRRELESALVKLEILGFVRKFSDEPEAWEIRRILKARLPVAELENLKNQLLEAATRQANLDAEGSSA